MTIKEQLDIVYFLFLYMSQLSESEVEKYCKKCEIRFGENETETIKICDQCGGHFHRKCYRRKSEICSFCNQKNELYGRNVRYISRMIRRKTPY